MSTFKGPFQMGEVRGLADYRWVSNYPLDIEHAFWYSISLEKGWKL